MLVFMLSFKQSIFLFFLVVTMLMWFHYFEKIIYTRELKRNSALAT